MAQPIRKIVQQLCDTLDEQCEAHSLYGALLRKERDAITHFESQRVSEIVAEREAVAKRIEQLKTRQIEAVSVLSCNKCSKLTELIAHHCTPVEAELLSPRAATLREIINASFIENRNLGHLTQFALNMIHGSLSILWSATQKSVKSYSADGKIHQAFQPTGARLAGIRREA